MTHHTTSSTSRRRRPTTSRKSDDAPGDLLPCHERHHRGVPKRVLGGHVEGLLLQGDLGSVPRALVEVRPVEAADEGREVPLRPRQFGNRKRAVLPDNERRWARSPRKGLKLVESALRTRAMIAIISLQVDGPCLSTSIVIRGLGAYQGTGRERTACSKAIAYSGRAAWAEKHPAQPARTEGSECVQADMTP